MARIFISYRRDDSGGFAGRLYDHLVRQFGDEKIFMDVDTIGLGVDYVEEINKSIDGVDVFLAVIGRDWFATDKAGRPRLDDPKDPVRLEVGRALQRGIPVIPILVRGAQMPGESELPEELASLARRNALELRQTRFASDVERLARDVRRLVPQRSDEPDARDVGQRVVDVPRFALLGQSGHGRTTLGSAIAMEAAHRFETDVGPTTPPEVRGAILVVAADDGPMPQTREHVQWAARSGVPILAVFLNKIDLAGDRELIELIELEVRELLSASGHSGDDIPVVWGTASRAFANPQDRSAGEPIREVVAALDAALP